MLEEQSFGGVRGLGHEDVALVFRVLFANEPRAYREAIADAVRAVGPPAAVFLAEPEDLDREFGRLAPHLVVCSRLSEAAMARATASWIELYADHGSKSRVMLLGERERTVEGIELQGLLEIVERAGSLIRRP